MTGPVQVPDLAIRDPDPSWAEVHHVISVWASARGPLYNTACDQSFTAPTQPEPLSSGAVTGALCKHCWEES